MNDEKEMDIEKKLKRRVKELDDDDIVEVSASDIQRILHRFSDYRQRFAAKSNKFDQRMAELMSKLANLEARRDRARDRLMTGGPSGGSWLEVEETAELIEEIERRRGKIVANRMLYGRQAPEELAQETIGVLNAAVDEAKEIRRVAQRQGQEANARVARFRRELGMKSKSGFVSEFLRRMIGDSKLF